MLLVTWNVSSLRARLPRLAFVGSTHVTADERGRLERLLDAGLVDAFRHLRPDEVGYRWWDYRAGHFHRRLGLRIDFALLSGDLADRLTTCGIDRAFRKGPKPSDHPPSSSGCGSDQRRGLPGAGGGVEVART